jgi:hypothetical protein
LFLAITDLGAQQHAQAPADLGAIVLRFDSDCCARHTLNDGDHASSSIMRNAGADEGSPG